MMTEQELHGLAAGHAVDALDDQEREAFTDHLTACQPCRQEVTELIDAAVVLSHGLEVQPPPELRGRLLRLVTAEAQGRARDTDLDDDFGTKAVPLRTSRGRHRRGATEARRGWLVAAAAAVVIGGGAWGVSQRVAPHPVHLVLNADDAREHESPDTPGLTLITSASADQAVLRLPADLSAPPSSSVLQAWFISQDGEARSAGVLDPQALDNQFVLLEGTVSDAALVGLTIEPAGGSAQPSTDPIAVLPLET